MRWLMIVGLMVSMSAWAGEDAAKNDLERVRELPEVKTERDAYITGLTSIVSAYVKVLNKEEEAATKAGSLELLEAIKAERDKINIVEPTSSGAKWDKNKNLATGQKAFNDGLTKARKDYLTKLEAVQKKFVQDKKIEEAKLVKLFVDDLKLEDIKKGFCTEWILFDDKKVIGKVIYKKDFTFSTADGKMSGTWSYKDGKITCKWVGGGENYIVINSGKLNGTNDKGDKFQGKLLNE